MSGSAQVIEPADDGGAAPEPRVNVEQRARNMGWMPKGAWRGEPDRWVDAATYVERGERMLPLLQERNRALDRTVSDLKTESRESKQLLSDLLVRTRKAEKVGYDRAMRELNQKRADAVAQGDAETFNKVEQEIREMGPAPEVPAPAPVVQAPPGVDPVVTAWIRRNQWFNRDREANAAAVAALTTVESENPGASLEEHLSEVEDRIAKRWPEHFPGRQRLVAGVPETEDEPQPEPEPNRRRAPAVMSSSTATERRPGARSFETMPADVKQQFERQKKMMAGKGPELTKTEFAEYYWETIEE
jgi:hypothetical protein